MGANLSSVDIGLGRTSVAVSAGDSHTCAILVRPGNPQSNQALNRGSAAPQLLNKRRLIPELSVKFACLVPQDDASIKCWGANWFGQLGTGDDSARGDDANGTCPVEWPIHRVRTGSKPVEVLTVASSFRVQRWG